MTHKPTMDELKDVLADDLKAIQERVEAMIKNGDYETARRRASALQRKLP